MHSLILLIVFKTRSPIEMPNYARHSLTLIKHEKIGYFVEYKELLMTVLNI